jgi:ribosomal protein S12 methylthiotransferase accessory factor
LPLQSVVNVLWSMYGVLREDVRHVRRTVPSGGALYGLRWFTALLRPMEGHAAGLYEVDYHVEANEGGALSLRRVPGSVTGAWGTLLTPTVLAFAHAVIYPVADLRFIGEKNGNRALTLALLEAGHALQNAALAAQGEAAATIVRGDTVEMEVLSLFGLGEELHPLPSLVLGAQPSDKEQVLAESSHQRVLVRSVPDHSLQLPLPTRVAVAGPIAVGERPVFHIWATGRSADARLATVKAEAEAWERIGWSTPGDLERARLDEFSNAVDPRSLVAYAQQQYRRDDFPYSPWSARRRYPWVKASRVRDGAEVWVMAQCVYALGSLQACDARRPYTNASTSGVAAFTDPASAQLRALVELIERDAFARAWLGRSPPPVLDETGLSGAVQHRLKRLRSVGYTVSAHLPASEYLPVVAVFAQRPAAAFTSVTTAAAFQLEEALDAALAETESRIQQAHDKPPHPPVHPQEVVLAGHHGDYFNTRAGFREADWFAAAPERISMKTLQGSGSPSDKAQLLDRLFERGHEAYVCDLTPPGASINQGRTPLYVARAFVSGLIPIWFGHGVEPLELRERGASVDGVVAGSTRLRPLHPCT